MSWLPELKGKSARGEIQTKISSTSGGVGRRYALAYKETWDEDRALTEALTRVTWVYRSVDAIAANAARVPFVIRRGDIYEGEAVESDLLRIFNSRANVGEDSFAFRYRLSAQLLLSNKGAFIEVERSIGGDVLSLTLLPPKYVKPVPDAKKFVKRYELRIPGSHTENKEPIERNLKPESVVWIRKPHPFNPYGALTPLEAAGLAIETDFLAKMYNRNFLLNDGRPGGLVVIKGDITEEDKEELRSRFRGGVGSAGRISIIASEDGADFVDTAVTPRDASYVESRKVNKEEILIAFGVPETVLANAAGRTFDNAEIERLIFWQETMMPHLELITRPLDVLDGEDENYTTYDVSRVDVLQRAEIKRREFLLREYDAGATVADEYRVATGRAEFAEGEDGVKPGQVIWIGKTRVRAGTADGSKIRPDAEQQALENAALPVGRPADESVLEEPEDEPREREDERLPERTASAHPEVTVRVVTESAPPVQVKEVVPSSVKVGSHDIDEDAFKTWKTQTLNDYDRWILTFERAMKRFYERQGRVVKEKLTGKKVRQTLTRRMKTIADADGISESDIPAAQQVKAVVATIFDQDVWDSQLREDMEPLIAGVMKEYGESAAAASDGSYDADSAAILSLITIQMNRLLKVNTTTADRISKALAEGSAADEDVDALVARIDPIFEDSVEKRAETAASTEVVAAAAGAVFIVMRDGNRGVNEKTWVTVGDSRVRDSHSEVDGMTIGFNDPFTVNGSSMMYPGDPDGPIDEVIQCRCALLYSDAEGPLL